MLLEVDAFYSSKLDDSEFVLKINDTIIKYETINTRFTWKPLRKRNQRQRSKFHYKSKRYYKIQRNKEYTLIC